MTNPLSSLATNGEIALMEVLAAFASEAEELREGYASLEAELALARDDAGWIRINALGGMDQFSKEGINEIAEQARLMYLKNPLINRGVEVKKDYTFAQGVTMSATWEALNTVIQAFLDDFKNQVELTSGQAMQQKEIERQTDGNLFLVLFTDQIRGRVRVRSIPLPEIVDVVTDPDDAKTVWYYKRTWTKKETDGTSNTQTAYYPHWRYWPAQQPPTLNGDAVHWDAPIYHLKTGGFSDWRYGVSDVYSALAWALAYKKFLEAWATVTQSLARFAWKATSKKGAKGVAAIQNRLNTTIAAGRSETNPPPAAGSAAVMDDGTDLAPLKTAGATTSMKDGREIKLMVAAAVGLPETFFGDAQAGALATARSLDRPTELMMKAIQGLWASVFRDLFSYVTFWATYALLGPLRSFGVAGREDDSWTVLWLNDPATGKPYNATVDVTFPPIVEIDPGATITAITAAAPRIPDPELIARLLLSALGVADIDEILADIDWDAVAKEQAQARQMAMQNQGNKSKKDE